MTTEETVEEELTPSEELFLEVLAARFRLGERLWTFSTKQQRTANKLESKGMISLMGGIIEKTFRASLTPAGKRASLDPEYTPPFVKDLKKSRRKSW